VILQSSRTTDIDAVAAVFMSRHAHDMIATRKMRFLDASIFLFPALILEVASVRTRIFFVISCHDILNRSAKNMFYFLLEGSVHFNPHASFVVTRDNRSGRNVTRQNKIVNALLQMKWALLQHHNERECDQNNDILKEKETLGTQNSYISPH
jgi:hypothetical protein